MIVRKYKNHTIFKSDEFTVLFMMVNSTGHISTNDTDKTVKVNQYLKKSNLDISNSDEDMFLFLLYLKSLQ